MESEGFRWLHHNWKTHQENHLSQRIFEICLGVAMHPLSPPLTGCFLLRCWWLKQKLYLQLLELVGGKMDTAKGFCWEWRCDELYAEGRNTSCCNPQRCTRSFQHWLMTFPYIVRSKTLLLKIELNFPFLGASTILATRAAPSTLVLLVKTLAGYFVHKMFRSWWVRRGNCKTFYELNVSK